MKGTRRIDQVLAGFAEGDAISSESVRLRQIFREMGAESEIYVERDHVSPEMETKCRSLPEYRGRADDIVIHHYSIASPAADVFLRAPGRKILVYHNITPAKFFRGYDDSVAESLEGARELLCKVAGEADDVWAVSEFNANELREAGVENVKVFPLLFSPVPMDLDPEPRIVARFAPPMTNILFVGRIAPNKCIEELILAYAWYHKLINPFSRLILVGSDRSAPRYFAMLRMLAGEIQLANVCFERYASPAGLVAYYEMADVFVSPSRHEGYCLPLVEAMYKGVPVIARETGGMPEAMGGAGVLYDDFSPVELAELIHRVASKGPLRDEVLASQRARVEQVLNRSIEEEIKALLG